MVAGVKATELEVGQLLEIGRKGGLIRFAGERAIVIDAVALGLLRKELVEALGMTSTRAVLTRFGYAHGWRTAESLKTAFPWSGDTEWHRAGGRIHQLQGQVLYEPVPRGAGTSPAHFAQAVWHDSYEAEQHLLQLGRSKEPVCWSLCGFASGYLSYCHGRQICCIEEQCLAKGDAICLMAGRPTDDWGPDVRSSLIYFEADTIQKALKETARELRRTDVKLRARREHLAEAAAEEPEPGLVVHSDGMRRVVDLARRVAHVDSTVLLTGESGVGKEVVAQLIHRRSARSARPFVAVNCAAVPEHLLESELFGHVRGSFTGALQDRVGLFEAANGGTLLLDEIGEMPLVTQAKLLRVLQEKEVRRVGENRTRKTDVRIVAATNRDLPSEVAAKRFREDLYYRLRVIELRIPSLRERPTDILPLARTFLAQVAAHTNSKVTGFSPAAADQLLRWGWPGNVRELQNVVERAVVLAGGPRVEVHDLPDEVRQAMPGRGAPGGPLVTLADVERQHILAVLDAAGGNRSRASAMLGIGPATLFRKIRAYGQG